jgi:hypothetical protein
MAPNRRRVSWLTSCHILHSDYGAPDCPNGHAEDLGAFSLTLALVEEGFKPGQGLPAEGYRAGRRLFIPNPFCIRPAPVMRTGALWEILVCALNSSR